MSDTQVPTFRTTSFVLMAIIFACALFVGVLAKWVEPDFVWGLTILLFVAFPHWIGLKFTIKQGATPAALIIGIFAPFWTLLGVCWMLLSIVPQLVVSNLDEVLRIVEPVMITLITGVALFHYLRRDYSGETSDEERERHNLGWILMVGLNGALILVWLREIGVAIGNPQIHSIASAIWISALGLYSAGTIFWKLGKDFRKRFQ